MASFTGDGEADQGNAYASVAECHSEAAIVVPPRSTAASSGRAETGPLHRDRHFQFVVVHGHIRWQETSGYTERARAEAVIGRWKQVTSNALRSHTDESRVTDVGVVVHALNRMLEFGRPIYVRIA